jgi:hypothetical protein
MFGQKSCGPEIAGRVVGRQQRKFLAARRREAVDMALHRGTREGVNVDCDRLAGTHIGQLGLFVIRGDVDCL